MFESSNAQMRWVSVFGFVPEVCESTHKLVPGPVTVLYPTVWLSSKRENDHFRKAISILTHSDRTNQKRARLHEVSEKFSSHHYHRYLSYIP